METKTWNTRKKPIEIHEYIADIWVCFVEMFHLLLCLIF